MKGGRNIDDVISFVDLTATILEVSGVDHPGGAYPLSGKSIMNILKSSESGLVDPSREYALAGRERHSSSRFNSLSYPQRAIRTRQYLYIRNFKPERWPAGAPQKYDPSPQQPEFAGIESVEYLPAERQEGQTLGDPHGGYHDIDASPSLRLLVENRDDPMIKPYFHLAVDKRPPEELYDIRSDPGCLKNLAEDPQHSGTAKALGDKLSFELKMTGDPRMEGSDIFESYRRFSPLRYFPVPDWAEGEVVPTPNWVLR